MSKVSFGTCNAKDLIALKQSLGALPAIRELLSETTSPLLKELFENMDCMEELYGLIDAAIMEEAPLSVREGGLIKDGYHEEVDHLREAKSKGASWLMEIEASERQKTGIKNLKIKYNKVFGYFLEVTQSYSELVPEYFIRKQTLANCERYITEELKKVEEEVLGADDKLSVLEYQLFTTVREAVLQEMHRLLQVSHQIAALDMYCALADVADKYHYVKPTIHTGQEMAIKAGRHPVVEKMMGEHSFIANDMHLNPVDSQMMLLTGPNMAGKSTFMRQVALITLMAQIGSFVPAESATISVVDRIFTRVGASDDLASGQSTFMVEMMEVSNILHHATSKSLLILDEIGRGTSTLDGLSIAWSIIEHITSQIGAKTLFATHYHELTVLEETIATLKNYCVAVKEMGEDIIFLHKIVPGSVDHSYGIQVAKLAGVPSVVLDRAKAILNELDGKETVKVSQPEVALVQSQSVACEVIETTYEVDTVPVVQEATEVVKESPLHQMNLFETVTMNPKHEKVIAALQEVDIMNMTPFKAMEVLYELQKQLR